MEHTEDRKLPALVSQFLKRVCPEQLLEEIEGDILQKFEKDIETFGEKKAKQRLAMNTIWFFRPGILFRNKISPQSNHFDMFIHYIKTFFRTSRKRGSYSFITISGLVLGMTTFALIALYVLHEQSYDNFHEKKGRIFRIRQDRYTHGVLTRQWTGGPWGIGPDLKNSFPEVVRYVSVNRGGAESTVLSNGTLFFREEKIFYATEDFFKLFSFPLMKGTDSLVLKRPFTMVISESLAKRYFGDANPIGKTLKNNGKEQYEITGVFKDVPANTHLKFDALFSYESLLKILGPTETQDLMSNWGWAGNYTYIELAPSANVQRFEAKLPAYIEKEAGEVLKSWGESMAFVLQPVSSIHLLSNYKDELEPNGDAQSVQMLTLIALFILFMALINYINLATARSMERAKEVGIRKVLGSHKGQLVRQFLVESFFIKLIALSIAALLVGILLPYFSNFVNRTLDVAILLPPQVWVGGLFFFLLGVITSGLYPAFALSGFKPIVVLKGRFKTSTQGIFLRKGLVTFQFVTSIVLLIITFIVYRQIKFMHDSKLGIDTEQMLVVQGPHIKRSDYNTRFDAFRQTLLTQSAIAGVAASSDVPGRPVRSSNGGVRLEGEEMEKGNSFRVVMTDEYFKETYGLQLINGRWFSLNFNDNWKTALVNETAMHLLGFTDPEKIIGKRILVWGNPVQIVGVVKDYHQESLKRKVDQLIFVCDRETSDYYSVKIKSNQSLQDVVSTTEERYKEAFPDNPFQYFFLEEYYNQQYQADRQFGKVFGLFTFIAMTIACLGLFGLSSYLVIQRTKEIGIRKVLGSSVKQIVFLVSKEFTVVVLLSVVIAWPVSYFLGEKWLNGFAYRTELDLLPFVIPAVCVFLISILTVAGQSIQAALADPVDSLKAE